jgi:hypothetical protein
MSKQMWTLGPYDVNGKNVVVCTLHSFGRSDIVGVSQSGARSNKRKNNENLFDIVVKGNNAKVAPSTQRTKSQMPAKVAKPASIGQPKPKAAKPASSAQPKRQRKRKNKKPDGSDKSSNSKSKVPVNKVVTAKPNLDYPNRTATNGNKGFGRTDFSWGEKEEYRPDFQYEI